MKHDGVYVARCVVADPDVRLLVPQVFDDTVVVAHRWIGDRPTVGTDGIVSFVGGDPAYPIWMGASAHD